MPVMGWRRIPNALDLIHVPLGRGNTTRDDSPMGPEGVSCPLEKKLKFTDVAGRHDASAEGFRMAASDSRMAAGAKNSMASPPMTTFDSTGILLLQRFVEQR